MIRSAEQIASRIVELTSCGRDYKPVLPEMKDYKQLGPLERHKKLLIKRNKKVDKGYKISVLNKTIQFV